MRLTGKSDSCGKRAETRVSSGPISGRRKMSESNTPESNQPKNESKKPKERPFLNTVIDNTAATTVNKTIFELTKKDMIVNKETITALKDTINNLQSSQNTLWQETQRWNANHEHLFGKASLVMSTLTNYKFWPWHFWLIIVATLISLILVFSLSAYIYNPKFKNLDEIASKSNEASAKVEFISGIIEDIKNSKDKIISIQKTLKAIETNVTNFINTPKQPTGKDAMVQTDPNISTQLGALKTELSQLKGSIPADISSKLNELTISVKNMSSAPAAPATPATTVSKPTNIEFDAKKMKDALKTEFGAITSNQSNLSTKIDAVSSSVSGSMAQMKADLDKINKIIGAQQEAKKEPKYQPVFLVVLSKGLNPQRDTLLLIFQKLLTLASDSPSKTSPTILVSANGNRQNVLSMSGYNQSTITTWHDSIDLREIKVPFDYLPTIINDKTGNSGQPKHVVVLAGHNYQLDKTKDLSAWDKIEKLTFVFVEPPFLSNLLWENFQKIQGLRRLKNLQTDVRIIKSMKDFGDNFKLEVDEVDDITRVMKAALAD
jgi:hypothetical protein